MKKRAGGRRTRQQVVGWPTTRCAGGTHPSGGRLAPCHETELAVDEGMNPHGQRRDPRAEKAFMVGYRGAGDSEPPILVPLKDLSRSGARFLTDREFLVGRVLELELRVPTAQRPMPLAASVVRVRKGPLGLYEHAVQFESVTVTSQQLIDEAVKSFLKANRNKKADAGISRAAAEASSADERGRPRATQAFVVRCRARGEARPPEVSPLRDLSATGARFLCERQFDVGATLEVELLIPTVQQPVPLVAKVVRVNGAAFGLYEHAVRFERRDSASQHAIEEAVGLFLEHRGRS